MSTQLNQQHHRLNHSQTKTVKPSPKPQKQNRKDIYSDLCRYYTGHNKFVFVLFTINRISSTRSQTRSSWHNQWGRGTRCTTWSLRGLLVCHSDAAVQDEAFFSSVITNSGDCASGILNSLWLITYPNQRKSSRQKNKEKQGPKISR